MKTYLKHKIINLVDVKEITALESLDFEGKYADYTERHAFWEVCYVESGNISCIVEDTCLDMLPGDILFIAPNQYHRYREHSRGSKAFVVCFESFSPPLKILCGSVFSLTDKQRIIFDNIKSETYATFKIDEMGHLSVLDNPLLGGQQSVLLYLELLLISILREIAEKENSRLIFLNSVDFHQDLVKLITDYLNENITEKLSLEQLCLKFNYSKSFLCKIFKQQTDESIFTYFNRNKINEAKRLLVETNYPAAAISDMLGFTDPKYFNTLFKKLTGVTTVKYRAIASTKQ